MFNLLTLIDSFDTLMFVLASFIALIFALVIHEASHAYVAYKMGDDTARLMGRITLNPIKHLDLLGFLCLMVFGFGWAKPVPVNPARFKNYRKGMILVSLAGVTANLILAFLSLGIFAAIVNVVSPTNLAGQFLTALFYSSGIINIVLMVFNLLPIYPLDGFNLISVFMKYNNKFIQFMKQYGQFVLLIFVFTVLPFLFDIIINPIVDTFLNFWGLWF